MPSHTRFSTKLKYVVLTALLIGASTLLQAQELNCIVKVNADQVQTSDRRVFQDMEEAFVNFLNNRKWTNDNFKSEELINCNMNITINSMPSIGSFSATVQVQSARPVYNSNYESIMLNFADRDWQFNYVESQPMNFTDNSFTDNLTSMLAYYAYMILAMDYDSFSEMGGSAYYQKALNVVTNAQQSGRPGWDQIGSTRNRYWLAENFTNGQMAKIRKGLYTYHRLAMDNYHENPEKSRQEIVTVLKDLKKTREIFPNSILVISILDAKSTELINIFSDGDMAIRREAYDILSAIDPAKRDEYKSIISSN